MKERALNDEVVALILKKLSGQGGDEEIERLEQLVSRDAENKRTMEEVTKIWQQTGKAKGITSGEVMAEWDRLEKVISHPQDQRHSGVGFLRIAAVITFVVFAGIALFFVSQRFSTTVLVADQITNRQMEDGSVITLYTNARLEFDRDYNDAERRVSLNGEAFFDVMSLDDKPFIVSTSHLEVTVVGTSFNVLSDPDRTEVIVRSGVVRVTTNGQNVTLEAGESGIYSLSGDQLFEVINEDPNFDSWKTKSFTFEDDPLEEVIKTLNKAYSASLYIENQELMTCPITVSFEDLNLDDILEVLGSTLSVQYESTAKGTLVSGSGC